MKLNTLKRLYLSLKEERYSIRVPDVVARKAQRTLEEMFSILDVNNYNNLLGRL